jgi:hypothetical protein
MERNTVTVPPIPVIRTGYMEEKTI